MLTVKPVLARACTYTDIFRSQALSHRCWPMELTLDVSASFILQQRPYDYSYYRRVSWCTCCIALFLSKLIKPVAALYPVYCIKDHDVHQGAADTALGLLPWLHEHCNNARSQQRTDFLARLSGAEISRGHDVKTVAVSF